MSTLEEVLCSEGVPEHLFQVREHADHGLLRGMDHVAAVGTLCVQGRPSLTACIPDQDLAGRDLGAADRAGAEPRALCTHGVAVLMFREMGGESV